jgi:hypothetical protein
VTGQRRAWTGLSGSWFHHWGDRSEESLDWTDRELPSHWGDRSEESLDWTDRELPSHWDDRSEESLDWTERKLRGGRAKRPEVA